MFIQTTIQATVEAYGKKYTFTFEDAEGLDTWKEHAQNTAAYGGKKSFIDLTSTRDAYLFGITNCVKH
tara:strand:- start:164 stop:367 length:204 start_codon:yes stop_codon:yes gene_type:complete